MFEEPKPRTWFDEDTIEIQTEPVHIEAVEKREPVVREPVAAAPVQEPDDDDDDTEGTWLVSTTMGSVFSKYVYICSKCGYRKESVLSLTPMTSCPECEKKKAMKA
jgi:rubrerythrin